MLSKQLKRGVWIVLLLLTLGGSAMAELQNVQIGALIEIRGRYHSNTWNGPLAPQTRIPGTLLPGRAIGLSLANTRNVMSLVDWDHRGSEWKFLETTTSLNFKADFTQDVTGFIEFYDTNFWGEDFRSNYITGADNRAVTNDDVYLLQSYIEVRNLFSLPLRLRIGRQQMQFGKGFLVANKYSPTQRQSFDAIRLTYAANNLTVDAWYSKLLERGSVEEDGDVDFYGVYATYSGWDALSVSAYWMLVRDARSLNDTNYTWFPEWVEDVFGLDDYDVTNLNTVGMRLFGKSSGFDYDLEVAYQFGNADAYGSRFTPFTYGDDGKDFDNWAIDGQIGYTFDMKWSPRIFIGGAWFEGEDNRDVSFLDWINPLYPFHPRASVSFNRMFSSINYCPAIQDNAWMTNFKQIRAGVTFAPTEKLSFLLRVQDLWSDEPFDWPVYFTLGRYRVFVAPNLPFWTQEGDDHQGYATSFLMTYKYSEDLTFRIYWGHLFADKGVNDGSYMFFNGVDTDGGTASDDADYAFFWIILKF